MPGLHPHPKSDHPVTRLGSWAVCALIAMLSACSGATDNGKGSAVFYPPLPNRPRIQFLTSYTSAEDIEQTSALSEFVVGKDDASKGGLGKPYSASLVGDRVVVSDASAHEIFVLDLAAHEFRPLKGNTGGGRARQPMQVTSTPDGTIYVADGTRNQVLAYGADESFLRAYGTEGLMKAAGVAVKDDEVYVCNLKNNDIIVFDRLTGAVKRRIGGGGKDPGKFYIPTNVAVGPDGDLYVSETGNFRVQRLHPDGTHVRMYGGLGDGPGGFSRPKGVAIDPDGRLYAVDAAFENVQIFDKDGQLLLFFGGPGNDPGNLVLPAGIDISARGIERFQKLADVRLKVRHVILVVSQYGARRVNVYGFGDWLGPEKDLPAPAKAAVPSGTAAPTTPKGLGDVEDLPEPATTPKAP